MASSGSDERGRLLGLLACLEEPALGRALREDDATLLPLARRHRLTPLLAATCADTLPPRLATACRRDRVLTAARNLALGNAAEICLRAFAEAAIPAIVLKGLAYDVSLYASLGGGVRATGDVDLLLPAAKRGPAFETLDRLGFEPRAAAPGFDDPDYHEVMWTRGGVEVDVHFGLAPTARCRPDYDQIWADAVPTVLGMTRTLILHRRHATVFHALHMAIDHFDIPAIYLLDLARLAPGSADCAAATEIANVWRCSRPLATAFALTAALLPGWRPRGDYADLPSYARGIVRRYGSIAPLPRSAQIVRKLAHFDHLGDLARYVLVQGRRHAREVVERRWRKRSARERLAVGRTRVG
jgi:hypothetical protein